MTSCGLLVTTTISQKPSIATEPLRLADFAGHWRITRDIQHDGGATAQFDGDATWTPQGEDMLYQEEGHLRIEGAAPLFATRSYLWKSDLSVWFSDGRFFHQVPAHGGDVHHDCPPDDYRGTYDFSNWPSFVTRWQVTGPRKSYRMTTTYTRTIT